jgi:hypothetical protein
VAGFDLTALDSIAAVKGRRIVILYASRGQFLQDVSELTRPQLYREFTDRAATAAARRTTLLEEHCNDMRLNVLLLRMAAADRATRENSPAAALLQSQVVHETKLTASIFAAQEPAGRDLTSAAIRQADEDVLSDMRLLARLCGTGPADLKRKYEALATLKESQVRKLRG